MLAAALAAVVPVSTQGQVALSKEVEAKIKGIQVDGQFTPQFSVPNVKDKRFRPKTWLEMDVAFEAKKNTSVDKNPVIDSLDFKYFIGLNAKTKEGKNYVLTASVNYVNIMEKEEHHTLVYVSPSALVNLLQKNTFGAADVQASGVEIYKGGALCGWMSSSGQRWWANLDAFAVVDGMLLPKLKTPFAPLWGDYDLESKAQ
jgi:hypothetical protein